MGRYADIAKKAADLTNQQLNAELSKQLDLRAASIDKLLPKVEDKQQFAELMAAVEKKTTEQEKLNFLSENIQKYGRVVVRVLGSLL